MNKNVFYCKVFENNANETLSFGRRKANAMALPILTNTTK